MKKLFQVCIAIVIAALPLAASAASPAPANRTGADDAVQRRAVEAAIWGMPLVGMDAMRQAYFRDAGAQYNDIIYWSKPADWRLQFTTPNASTYYIYFNFNLRDGPVVLDVPAAVGAGLFGSIVDAWQVPVTDVGPAGDDAGKGGKYLLVPPNYKEPIPAGHFPIQFETLNGYGLLRAIPAGKTADDVSKAIDLVKQLRLYSFAQAANPPTQRYIDMAGKLIDGVVAFSDTFYVSLARMVEEEPVLPRDKVAMGMLRSLGIEKGKSYNPDPKVKQTLGMAAQQAHRQFITAVHGGEPWWPGTHWKLVEDKGAKTGFSFIDDNAVYLDERGLIFFMAFAAPKKLGAATFYLVGATDSTGKPLDGSRSYELHVPANVPAKQYWAVTLYDLDTACLIRNMSKPGLDSYNQEMKRNADGSVDLYFGPKAPVGKEANWIPTAPRRTWFSLFRFYGPDKAMFDKTWTMDSYQRVP
jgi:hypothetical protein